MRIHSGHVPDNSGVRRALQVQIACNHDQTGLGDDGCAAADGVDVAVGSPQHILRADDAASAEMAEGAR